MNYHHDDSLNATGFHHDGVEARVLFCYQFCTLGGCETVLRERMTQLELMDVRTHALFLEGGDGLRLFDQLRDQVTIARDPMGIQRLLRRIEPHFVVSIDTPQIFTMSGVIPQSTTRVLEVHTTYPEGLRYLSSMPRYQISGIFTPSSEQRKLVQSLLPGLTPGQVQVVPNPLPAMFHCDEVASPHARPIVLWVGRLDAHKNWRQFIEIAGRLNAQGTEAEFWIVGGSGADAQEKEALWKTLCAAGLSGRLRWIPRIEHDRMPDLYRYVGASHGCLLSTSRQESFGMTALEAMACGCPVIVPDIGGFRDFVIPGQTGLRFPLGDATEAVRLLNSVLADAGLRARLIEEAVDWANREFTAPVVAQKLRAALFQLRAPAQLVAA